MKYFDYAIAQTVTLYLDFIYLCSFSFFYERKGVARSYVILTTILTTNYAVN